MALSLRTRSIAGFLSTSLVAIAAVTVLADTARAANPTLTPVVISVGSTIAPVATVDMSGLTAPVTLTTSTALPTGLALDAGDAVTVGTGLLSGTPTVASALATYTITATDSSIPAVVRSVDLPLTVTSLRPPADITASFGQPLTGAPTATAQGLGTGVSFALVGAPSWLTISNAGVLSGTPTAALAASSIGITATDAAGASATGSFSLTVLDALTPPTQTVSGIVGTALTPTAFTTSVVGTYSINPPISTAPGLAFDPSTGVISGTPSKPLGPTVFTVQLTPSAGGAPLQATITVSVDVVLGTTPLNVTGTVGSAITAFIGYASAVATTAGLAPPFAYSTTPALPGATSPGDLTINPTTGAITGRPTTAVVGAKYVVNLTDKNGAKGSGPITVTVGGQVLPTAQALVGSVGSASTSKTLTASGMTAPIAYSISPALPSGLLFGSTTGVVSGIPRTAQSVATYTISAVDANGATGSAALTITVGKALLSPPIIGAIQSGSKAGSILVNFTPPRLAPSDQTYTVQVYDADGYVLITSVDAKSSPVAVDGLTPGETYQIVVVANATSTFDRVESLPKTGIAALSAPAVTSVASAPAAATVAAKVTKVPTLSSQGFVLALGTQVTAAKRVVLTTAPSRREGKAPTARLRLNQYSRVVVSGLPWKGVVTVSLSAQGTWIPLGTVRVPASRTATLPAFAIRNAGRFTVRLAPPAGAPVYVRLVVKKAT